MRENDYRKLEVGVEFIFLSRRACYTSVTAKYAPVRFLSVSSPRFPLKRTAHSSFIEADFIRLQFQAGFAHVVHF